ncbi:hypothetical protein MLD38_003650 [Melastoma candidum]|uniref:Uncharacterized protein n=1 Tax=Melastoma candidum TaxID=119954 RepID=A0ACB9S755_9MYRT|nr:hypothetical protein MLD38_003650 [Melastoma candidum]
MGLSKFGRLTRLWRGAKTLFFLLNLLVSLLFLSAPVLLAIADSLLPSLLLCSSLPPTPTGMSLLSLRSRLNKYDFRRSLVDVPLISIVRSAAILCVYSLCNGPRLSRGPYLGITTVLCLSSLAFVSLKACLMLARPGSNNADEIMLVACSLSFAVGHVVAAYRTSCRERRKLLVYKIDIEQAVSACKKDGLALALPLFLYHHPKLIRKGRGSEILDLEETF